MIKAKDGCLYRRERTGRVHIYCNRGAICGDNRYSGVVDRVDSAEESEICKTCLKIARKRGLIEEVSDKPAQDPIKAKLHEYECRAKAAEDEVAELNAANDELNEDDAQMAVLLCDYERATNGHTLENIKTIMEQVLPASLLEERTIESARVSITVEPIVEYLTDEEITDELVEKHGRIPCEVKDNNMGEWHPALLLHVEPFSGSPFSAFSELDTLEAWEDCRIKAETLTPRTNQWQP